MSIEQVPMTELLAWSGEDPVVRAEASPATDLPALGLRRGDTRAFVFLRPTLIHGISLMFRGEDALLHELVGSSPFGRPGQRWVGVRDTSGVLLAVGCCELEASGAPVLSGITVVPRARGLALGRGVTAELTRQAVSEHGWCTLGLYSHNDRAREVYRSVGYVVRAEWSSGRLG